MLRRNALIFHQAALGDFVLTWPIALALARIAPQSRVIYVTQSEKGKLAERVLRVDSADSEAGWHTLLQQGITATELPPNVSKMLEAAHTAVSFSGGAEDPLADALQRLYPQINVLRANVAHGRTIRASDAIIDQLELWPALASAARQLLAGINARGLAMQRQPAVDVLIHPGAGSEAKRWPSNCFRKLAQKLVAAGAAVRFIIGEVEKERWSPAEFAELTSVGELRELSSLAELLDEIKSAYVFLGNDSGPGHLAGILGLPVVSIFGPTDPQVWRPLGPRVHVVRGEPIESIPVDSVFAPTLAALKLVKP